MKFKRWENSTEFRFPQSRPLRLHVPHRCRDEGGDVCTSDPDEGLSPSEQISTGTQWINQQQVAETSRPDLTRPDLASQAAAPPPALPHPNPHLPASWLSPCRRSWQPGGSSPRLSPRASGVAARRWRWTNTAPTPRRPSPSTTSTRDDSSRHTFTCESLWNPLGRRYSYPGFAVCPSPKVQCVIFGAFE